MKAKQQITQSLIFEDLFEQTLLLPAKECNKLCILTGFATASMAKRHIDKVNTELRQSVDIDIIVGMTPTSGIGTSHHEIFRDMTDDVNLQFSCSYVTMSNPPVHSKVYIWLRDNVPILSFIGSANYTQHAFFSRQKEVLSYCNPKSAYDYYNLIVPDTVICNHIEAEDYCRKDDIIKDDNYLIEQDKTPLDSCELSLVSLRNGEIQDASGLNWGQSRALKNPKNPRNRSDAYIPIPAEIRKKSFFPARGRYFSVRTDDGYTFTCVIAQDHGKAIHTPNDNSEIGLYFRARLGLDEGVKIRTNDLDRYGRRTVTFVKLDEEDYYMDFSK